MGRFDKFLCCPSPCQGGRQTAEIWEKFDHHRAQGRIFRKPKTGCIELAVGQPTVNADLVCEVHNVFTAFAIDGQDGVTMGELEK